MLATLVCLVLLLGLLSVLFVLKPFFIVRILWWTYGYVYDGLLFFYPYRNLLTKVEDRLAAHEGKTLEIGCGTGNVLRVALRYSPDVTGVDLSASMLRAAKRKLQREVQSGKVSLYHNDIASFLATQPDNTYDTIISVNVLYAIEQREQIWQELFRVMKTNGKMIMTTSVSTGSKQLIREHMNNANNLHLFRPRLLAVFLVDNLIDLLAGSGQFEFPSVKTLRGEVERNGGIWSNEERCYGGEHTGVNVMFTVSRA